MSLDLGETLLQMDRAAREWRPGYESRQERLARLLTAAAALPPELAREKTRNFVDPFLAAEVQTDLLGESDAPPPPADWAAASVDGSHIDVDRHLPVACYLLNLGGCVLTYGRDANARFFSHPQLAYRPEDLYLRDREHPAAEEAVAGPLLGLRRMVRELERLAAVVAEIPPDLPVLALVDGTLVLWGLGGQGYPPFVRDALVQEGLLPALESLRQLAAAGRPVTLAAYVSLPRVTEVVNAIRRCLCPGGIEPLPGILRPSGSPLQPVQRGQRFPRPGYFRRHPDAVSAFPDLPHQFLRAAGTLRPGAAGLLLLFARRRGNCPGGSAAVGRRGCRFAGFGA